LQEYTVLKLPLPILRSVPIYFGVSNGSELGGDKSELFGDKSELFGDKSELFGDKSELGGDKSELFFISNGSKLGGDKSELGLSDISGKSKKTLI
jgi:hypothetical protein